MAEAEFLAAIPLVLSTLVNAGWDLGLRLSGRRLSDAPFETWPRHARAMRWTVSVWILALLLALTGFAGLSALLDSAGDGGMGRMGLVLLALAAVFVILEGTHHITLGIWSAAEAAHTGSRPEFAAPLSRWAGAGFQRVFLVLWHGGVALTGSALLRSGLLPLWAGGAALGWSVLWLGAFAARGVRRTWGMLAPVPLVLGAALLLGA